MRWEVGRFLVLIKDGGRRVSPSFYLFVSVNQGNTRDGMGSRFSCVSVEMERLSLDLSVAVKNIVGRGSVWNL